MLGKVVGLMVVAGACVVVRSEPLPQSSAPTVSGVVIADDPAQPVRRAVVTVSGSGLTASRTVMTNDVGRFSVPEVPPGNYTITAERPGFITSAYGSKRPGRPGVALTVTRQSVTDLMIRLWRGAVVAGVVEDNRGQPVPGIPVRAIQRRRAVNSSWESLSNNGAKTDESGEFRIYGLEPGSYLILASPPATEGSEMLSPTASQVDAILDHLRRRRSAPASEPDVNVRQISTDVSGYIPTVYPATTSLEQASPIVLVAGQEMVGIRIALQRVRTGVVTGTVLAPSGVPARGATLQLVPPSATAVYPGFPAQRRTASTREDGQFEIGQVIPGRYSLLVRYSDPAAASGTTEVAAGAGGSTLAASSTIEVAGDGVAGLVVRLSAGVSLKGRARFTRQQADTSNKPNPQCRLILSSELATYVGLTNPEGLFSIPSVLPGAYILRPAGGCATPSWWPLSASSNGSDLFDGPVQISSDTDLDVVFLDRPSTLTGTLQQSGGAPVSDLFVVAYSVDQRFWQPQTRRVQAVRPAKDGTYSMRGLPDGDYFLGAVTDVDPDDWGDPAFLAGLVSASVKVTVRNGQTTTQGLEIRR